MLKDKKKFFTILIAILAIGCGAFFLFKISNPSEDALVDAKIPEETKRFFRNLVEQGLEIKVDFTKKLKKKDFDNKNDIGNDPKGKFSVLGNENFIVYYHGTPGELNRARALLNFADASIQPLTDFFGIYYYPALVQGRKLPLYLANSAKDYKEICAGLGFNAIEWSVAITSIVYDNANMSICRGIVFSDKINNDKPDYFKETVLHEMAHYVHFSAMHLSVKKTLFNWECEGIATYVSGEKKNVDESKIQLIKLDQQLENYRDSYWVGYSVFNYIDATHGTNKLYQIVRLSFDDQITNSISTLTNNSFEDFERSWRNYYR